MDTLSKAALKKWFESRA